MKLYKMERGSVRGEFEDRYGDSCSIQESGASDRCIWLGVNIAPRRMYLTQDMARELLPLLQCFVETGGLPREMSKQDEQTTKPEQPEQDLGKAEEFNPVLYLLPGGATPYDSIDDLATDVNPGTVVGEYKLHRVWRSRPFSSEVGRGR